MSNEINIVRAIRDQLGETQEVFSRRFDVTSLTISLWERHGPPDRGPVRKMLRQLQDDLAASRRLAS